MLSSRKALHIFVHIVPEFAGDRENHICRNVYSELGYTSNVLVVSTCHIKQERLLQIFLALFLQNGEGEIKLHPAIYTKQE